MVAGWCQRLEDVPPPPQPLAWRDAGLPLPRCWSKGCPYARHSSKGNDGLFKGYCCNLCREVGKGITVVLDGRGRHGIVCEHVMARGRHPRQCLVLGCNLLRHSKEETRTYFIGVRTRTGGDFCCNTCFESDGQRHGGKCEGEKVPAPLPDPLLALPAPPSQAAQAPLRYDQDLALGRPVEASSEYAGALAACAVDGSSGTHWSPPPESKEGRHWLSVDLGDVYRLARVVVVWEATFPKNYQIRGSDDGRQWQSLASEVGREGMVVTPLLGMFYRHLRIFCTDSRPCVRKFCAYPLVTDSPSILLDDQVFALVLECLGESFQALACTSSSLLGLTTVWDRVWEPGLEGTATAVAASLPAECRVAAEALGFDVGETSSGSSSKEVRVEAAFLRESRYYDSLQEMRKEIRRNGKRRAELADPKTLDIVLERAVRKAFACSDPARDWKQLGAKITKSGAAVELASEDDLIECNVYDAVHRLREGVLTLPLEFFTFALESITEREPASVYAILQDLCRCAQPTLPPLEVQLSLGAVLFEKATSRSSPSVSLRFKQDLLETRDGALSKFIDCMDHYFDEHKEKAFMSAFVAPAHYYLRKVQDASTADDILHNGQSLSPFFVLLNMLGVRMPRLSAFWSDAIRPHAGVVDFWNGLSDEAKELFKRPEHFGRQFLPEDAEVRRPVKKYSAFKNLLFRAHQRPAKLVKALFSCQPAYLDERKKLSGYIEPLRRFAEFFEPVFFLEEAFKTLRREHQDRPEYVGFSKALDTLYLAYRQEELGPGQEATVSEHLDSSGVFDFDKASMLLKWIYSEHRHGSILRAQPKHQNVIEKWLDQRKDDEEQSEPSEDSRCYSSPATHRSKHCFLPGTFVRTRDGLCRVEDLEEGKVLLPSSQGSTPDDGKEVVVKRKIIRENMSHTERSIMRIRYRRDRRQHAPGRGARDEGDDPSFELKVTRTHHILVRRCGEDVFLRQPAYRIKPDDFLRNSNGDQFRVVEAVPNRVDTYCVEVFLENSRSTMFVGMGDETPRDAFVEAFGELGRPRIYIITFRRGSLEDLMSPRSLPLQQCIKRMWSEGFSQDLSSYPDYPEFHDGHPKIFVQPPNTQLAIDTLSEMMRNGKLAKGRLNSRTVIIDEDLKDALDQEISFLNKETRRQKQKRYQAANADEAVAEPEVPDGSLGVAGAVPGPAEEDFGRARARWADMLDGAPEAGSPAPTTPTLAPASETGGSPSRPGDSTPSTDSTGASSSKRKPKRRLRGNTMIAEEPLIVEGGIEEWSPALNDYAHGDAHAAQTLRMDLAHPDSSLKQVVQKHMSNIKGRMKVWEPRAQDEGNKGTYRLSNVNTFIELEPRNDEVASGSSVHPKSDSHAWSAKHIRIPRNSVMRTDPKIKVMRVVE